MCVVITNTNYDQDDATRPRVKCFEDCEEFKEEDVFYDARDAYTPEENQEADRKQEGDEWLSNDIKMRYKNWKIWKNYDLKLPSLKLIMKTSWSN